jgi:hypothetical protein
MATTRRKLPSVQLFEDTSMTAKSMRSRYVTLRKYEISHHNFFHTSLPPGHGGRGRALFPLEVNHPHGLRGTCRCDRRYIAPRFE